MASGANEQNPAIKEAKIQRRVGRKLRRVALLPEKSHATKPLSWLPDSANSDATIRDWLHFEVACEQWLTGYHSGRREYRNFQITAEPIDQIIFWYNQVPDWREAKRYNRPAGGHILFRHSCLMAAARPEIRDA